jgi:membrane-bound lytic murein transglycosylase B
MKFLCAVLFMLVLACPAHAGTGFDAWRTDFRQEAKDQGLTSRGVEQALAQMEFLPEVIELDRKQPEGSITFSRYVSRTVSDDRVAKGRELLSRHRTTLEKVAREYGVPAKYIVALWGIETSFGQNTGNTDVVSALATLAYEGRRADFFRDELLKALRIIQEGHVTAYDMTGSWAGAMGQCQFMPSSFLSFAQDGDGDGHKDIWNSLPDVFASAANYLAESGWREDEAWGREVRVPNSVREDWIGLETRRPLGEWSRLGVRLRNGDSLPQRNNMVASLVMPDGIGGRGFLVYDNYRVIMKWNRSTYFATSVGLLADRIGM